MKNQRETYPDAVISRTSARSAVVKTSSKAAVPPYNFRYNHSLLMGKTRTLRGTPLASTAGRTIFPAFRAGSSDAEVFGFRTKGTFSSW